MSKSKLSKRQIAGAFLLSSTVIGATASGTASANFMDFMNTIGSVAGKVGNFVSGHAWGVVAAIGLLSALTYGTSKAIKAGINYYNFRNAKNNLLYSINDFLDTLSYRNPLMITIFYDRTKTKTKKSQETILEYLDIDYKQITNNLNKLKKSVSSSEKGDNNMCKAKETINKAKKTISKDKVTINKVEEPKNVEELKNKALEDLIELFNEIENNYEKYCKEYDKLNSNK